MDFFLEKVIVAIVWVFANVLYVDLRRKGARKGRLLSFIVGYPGTLLSFILVRERGAPRLEPPEDDEESLLREIRVDRRLRGRGGERKDNQSQGSRDGPEPRPDS